MKFYLPVKLYEEENCVYNHRKEIAVLGTKALIVTGRHSSKMNGSLDDLKNALDDEGIKYFVFDEIEENPSTDTVMKAREIGLNEKADIVIGLGGGSPIDAAKAISIMMMHSDKDEDFLYDKNWNIDDTKAYPVVAIPTTCGTGSEATAVSVLTIHKKRTKASIVHRLFPVLSLVDAKYLRFAPMSVIQATAVDALGHLIESYINTAVNDYIKMFIDAGLKTWSKSKDVILGKRSADINDYKNLMNASTFAGMAIAHDGTTLPHSLSYMLTYEEGVAHGKAIGYFIPGYVREADADTIKYIVETSGFSDIEEFSSFIYDICGIDGIPENVLKRSIDSVLANPAKLNACPYPVDEDVLRRISSKNI